jgi:hypothetical protein
MSKSAWFGKSMPEMWLSAQAADTQMAWEHVTAWGRTHDLLEYHESRLRAARDALTAAWPPQRSPAATAFAEHIDGLLLMIGQSKSTAVENRTALAGVLASLRDTKNDIYQMVAEWEGYQATPVHSHRTAVVPPSYQVTQKAQARMDRNDQEVFAAYRQLTEMPGPWDGQFDDGGVPFGNPGTNRDLGSDGGSSSANGSMQGAVSGNSLLPRPVRPLSEIDAGVGLAGGVVPPSASAAPSSAAGLTPVPLLPEVSNQTGVIVGRPTGVGPIPPGGTQGVGKRPGEGPSSKLLASDRSGGISGVPAELRANPSPLNAGVRTGSGPRTNPIGGVIGGGGTSIGSAGMPIGGQRHSGASGRPEPDASLTLRWEVEEGGPPVIESVPERPFELGPGVIGVDR